MRKNASTEHAQMVRLVAQAKVEKELREADEAQALAKQRTKEATAEGSLRTPIPQ